MPWKYCLEGIFGYTKGQSRKACRVQKQITSALLIEKEFMLVSSERHEESNQRS